MTPEFTENPVQIISQDADYSLIKQASNGDRNAFCSLFDKHVSRIYAFCLRMSADKDIADELTQIAFVKAWEKMDTFKYASKFTTWLHGIAMNEFLTYKRAGKTFSEKINVLFRKNESRTGYTNCFDTNIDVENAISRLTEQTKAVVILHDVEGYKHKEISEIMGIAVGTSKAALHRARKQLRKELIK